MMDIFYLTSIVRRALLLCSLLIASCSALFGQADGLSAPAPVVETKHGQSVDRQIQQLTQRLGLNDAQQSRITALLKNQKRQIDVVHKSMQSELSESDANREKIDEIRDFTDSKIAAVLSERQRAKFAQWKEQQKIAMQRRRQAPEGEHPTGSPSGF